MMEREGGVEDRGKKRGRRAPEKEGAEVKGTEPKEGA
jgi:hypothetical protein